MESPRGGMYLRLFAVPAQSFHSTFVLLSELYLVLLGHTSPQIRPLVPTDVVVNEKMSRDFCSAPCPTARPYCLSRTLDSSLTQNGIPGPRPSCLVFPSPVVPIFAASGPIQSRG